MLMQGDFDSTSVQIYADSMKEVLKQTMLKQEYVFRNQVLELHRLYGIQKNLMKNSGCLEIHGYNFTKASIQSTSLHCTKAARYIPMVKETSLASATKEDSASIKVLLEEQWASQNKRHCRPLDLQLPADQYIRSVYPEELNLSLAIGEDSRRKECAKKAAFQEDCYIFSKEVIDLEETDDDLAANLSPAKSAISAPNYRGRKTLQSDFPINNLSSNEVRRVDLNEVYMDDSSCHSNDPIFTHGSTASSSRCFSGAVGKVQECTCPCPTQDENKTFSDEPSRIPGDLMDSNDNIGIAVVHAGHSRNSSEVNLINVGSAIKAGTGLSEDLQNDSDDRKSDCIVSSLEIQDVASNDQNSVSLTVTCDGILPSLCKSRCCSENNASNVNKLQNSSPSTDDRFSGTHLGPQATEISLDAEQEEQRPSDSNESKNGCVLDKQDSAEVDLLIQSAAELLLCISLGNAACCEEISTKTESNDMENKQMDEPQHSLDSFELFTLKLTECGADEDSASSKPSGFDSGEKDFGLKLKRGRRMKDFQKEILPGLASLSRHEILEDINILEAVLRSREYKRIRDKQTADAHLWSTPVRSKRSRLNNVRRRIFF